MGSYLRVPVRLLAAPLGALLGVLTACGGPGGAANRLGHNDPDGLSAVVLPQPYQVPHLTLTDSHGQPFDTSARLTKRVTLVFFGYTRCRDVCQAVMADITAAVRRLPAPDREDVGMIFVTSDPTRDDPPTLRRYLDRFDPTFEGLTAPLATVAAFGDALGVAVERGPKLASGRYDVRHGTQIVGVLPDGSAPLVWTAGTTSQQLASDLEHVLHSGVPDVTADPETSPGANP